MGTIADKLNYLLATKNAIKQAIINKGVTVEDTDTFRSYANKISNIPDGAPLVIRDASYMFYNGARFDLFDRILAGLTDVTTTTFMFTLCGSKIPVAPDIDMSKVTDASYMFQGTNISQVPAYNLSSLKNAKYMFGSTKITNLLNLDFSKVLAVDNMFSYCTLLKTVVNVDFSWATSAYFLFSNCYELELVDTIKVPSANISYMFSSCKKLQSILNLNVGYSTTFGTNTFYGCTALARLTFTGTTIKTSFDIATTGLLRTGLVEMFNSLPPATGAVKITMGSTKLALLTEEDKLIATSKGYSLT